MGEQAFLGDAFSFGPRRASRQTGKGNTLYYSTKTERLSSCFGGRMSPLYVSERRFPHFFAWFMQL